MTIRPPDRHTSENLKEGWDTCDFCGSKHIQVDIKFNSGATEPTIGETITGASSGATCVLVSVSLVSGSYTGPGHVGDVVGWLKYSAPSAWDFDTLRWGTSGENLNGSTSGNSFAVLDEYGEIKKYGILYPRSELIERDGKRDST